MPALLNCRAHLGAVFVWHPSAFAEIRRQFCTPVTVVLYVVIPVLQAVRLVCWLSGRFVSVCMLHDLCVWPKHGVCCWLPYG